MDAEHVHTANNIKTGVEHSLRRMKTDYLILIHATYKENDVLQDGLRQTLASQGC